MIFLPKHCTAIRQRRKTATRRLVRGGDRAVYEANDPDRRTVAVYDASGRLKWSVGHTYAIQPGRGKFAEGRFLLRGIYQQPLQKMDRQDCIEEGLEAYSRCGAPKTQFQLLQEFADLWDGIHTVPGEKFADNPDVWALSIKFVGEEDKNDGHTT